LDSINNVNIDPELGLAFKALIRKNGKYVSQWDKDFVWPPGGFVTSECAKTTEFPYSAHDENKRPFSQCSCGIYAAYTPSYALQHKNTGQLTGGLFMLQPYGPQVDWGNKAVRSMAANLVAVVEYSVVTQGISISTSEARRHFNLPILDPREAVLAFEIHMLEFAYRNKLDWWEPANYPKNKIAQLIRDFAQGIAITFDDIMTGDL
jgi:hypothetical protein